MPGVLNVIPCQRLCYGQRSTRGQTAHNREQLKSGEPDRPAAVLCRNVGGNQTGGRKIGEDVVRVTDQTTTAKSFPWVCLRQNFAVLCREYG